MDWVTGPCPVLSDSNTIQERIIQISQLISLDQAFEDYLDS